MSLTRDTLFDISGKVALVTGGSSGIGTMIAATLAANGVTVYIVGRNGARLEQAARAVSPDGACRPLAADLSRLEEIERLAGEIAEREKRLHILVNNAGATWGAPAETFPVDGWDKVMTLNLRSPFFLTQKLLPLLATEGEDWGRVINLSSIGARMIQDGASIPYGASKAALEQVTRMMAFYFGPHHVTANAIAPGWFPSRMNAPIAEQAGEAWRRQTPLKRLGTAADIGGLAVFLCSPAGVFVNGQTIACDGGRSVVS
jgi:NAD(P)-dependent dehydrogenase (short-subunit alcohol dehydrogenase family)